MLWKLLGSAFLIRYGLSLLQFKLLMLKLYILPMFGIKVNLKKYGSWAVVTGATDGIGKAIAKLLAKQGLNVVLISRTEEKLKAVAEEFESYNVQVKTLQFDFSNPDGYDDLKEELKELDIGVLVNNVGASYDHPDFYLHFESDFFRRMNHINITSIMEMSRIVLEGMVQRGKGGIIVHVSSSSSYFPMPLLTGYGASKAFVNMFSQGLSYEYKKYGIKNHVVTPYFVASKLSKLRPSGLMIPSADAFAKQMVNSIGLTDISCGFWSHDLMMYLLSFLPNWLVIGHMFKMFMSHRKRWIKKQEQKKE